MEVKINREIRDYTESVFFGMPLRQCVFAAIACAAAVALYFALEPYLGIEELSWVCILGAAPFAAIGFIKWHGMTAEQFVIVWVKSELLTPKRLISRPENLYYDAHVTAKKQEASPLSSTVLARLLPTASDETTDSPAPKRLSVRLEDIYVNVLARLYEQANGKRDVHDKDAQ